MSSDVSILERLRRLDACAVSDALDRLGVPGALGGFRRWGPSGVVAGNAVTVRLEPGPAPAGAGHLGTRALELAGPAHVIVVANAGRCDAGSWGGLLTLEAHRRGIAGVVLDGALRDGDEVEGLGVPVFGWAATPRTARGRYHEVATNEPVFIEGIRVDPGDLVVADGSGAVFVPAGLADRVVEIAEGIRREEARLAAALRQGAGGVATMDTRYERMLEREAG